MNKEEIYQLIEQFGLKVDYDQWDIEGNEWIRVVSEDWPKNFGYKNNCLILYKNDGKSTNILDLRQSLIDLGGNIKASVIREALIYNNG